AGSRSVTCTFVAVSGPIFERLMVKVTVPPTLGVGLLTVLANARSACCGVVVIDAELLATLGSNWSELVTVAVLVCAAGETILAWMVSVWGVVVVTVPTVHTPVVLS